MFPPVPCRPLRSRCGREVGWLYFGRTSAETSCDGRGERRGPRGRRMNERRWEEEVVRRETQVRAPGDCYGYLFGCNVFLSITPMVLRKVCAELQAAKSAWISLLSATSAFPHDHRQPQAAGERGMGEIPRQPEVEAAALRSERCSRMEPWSRAAACSEHHGTATTQPHVAELPGLLLATSHVSSLGVFQKQQTGGRSASCSLGFVQLAWTTYPSKRRQAVNAEL